MILVTVGTRNLLDSFRNIFFIGFVKEAIYIRKEGAQSMNRDEGSNQLSHASYRFLGTTSSPRVKNRKN